MKGAITERELVAQLKMRRDRIPLEHYQGGSLDTQQMTVERGVFQGWSDCIEAIGEIFKQQDEENDIDDGSRDDS